MALFVPPSRDDKARLLIFNENASQAATVETKNQKPKGGHRGKPFC